MTSFLKYQQDEELRRGNGRGGVSFNRAHLDGVPWRGPSYPLREEEYYDYTEEVLDFDVGVFDIRNPREYRELRRVLDRAVNNWYRIADYDKRWVERPDGSSTVLVYIMWVEPYRELAKNRALAELAPTPVPMAPQALPHS